MLKHITAALLLALSSLAFAAETIDINTADATTIATNMKGVGEAKAAAIVAYRTSNGAFQSVDDLVLVKGIGAKTLESNREVVMVGQLQ